MGYACPVCAAPQADDEHLAHHLAITAAVHGGEHAAWLDRHVPDWGDRGSVDLAPLVAEHATSVEFDRVFDDTTADPWPAGDAPVAEPPRDEEARRILREARELTGRMAGTAEDGSGDDA